MIDMTKLTRPTAERDVLGCCALEPEILDWIPITVEHFADLRNRVVFEAMQRLREDKRPIDESTLEHSLAHRLEAIGGLAYVADLIAKAPAPVTVEHYAQILEDALVLRRVALAVGDVARQISNGAKGSDALDAGFAQLSTIAQANGEIGTSLGDAVLAEFKAIGEDIDKIVEVGRADAAMPFGVELLDRVVGGSPYGVLTVVGARPGTGKSSLVVTTALHVTDEPDDGYVILSYEDRARGTARRCLANLSGVPLDVISRRSYEDGSPMSREDYQRVMYAAEQLRSRHNLLIVSCHGRTFAEAARQVRAHARRYNVKGFALDYIQNVPAPGGQMMRPVDRLDANVLEAEALVGEMNISGIVLSQFNREGEKENRRPKAADFKGSGKLEESGKLILALHDPKSTGDAEHVDGALEIHVLKHYQGRARDCLQVHFDAAYCRIGRTETGW